MLLTTSLFDGVLSSTVQSHNLIEDRLHLKIHSEHKLFPSFQPDPAMHPHHWHRSHELLHALRLGREGCHFYDEDNEEDQEGDV